MKRLNRLWSRRRSWSSPGPSWPPETPKVETDTYVEKATVSLRSWSGTFRAELHNAWADEWEKITGATEISSVSRAVWKQGGQNWFLEHWKYFNEDQQITWTELWERSTIIPSRFISFISVWKVFVRTGRMTHWIHLWTYQVLQPFVSLGGLLKINSLEIMMDHLKWLYRVCFGLPPPKFQVWKT